ncbi:MAG: argininosuccinate lyase, partial [Acidobacteriota bacterium]|nr:argininosuccinate lyase [Acidobacteriota bacterium]
SCLGVTGTVLRNITINEARAREAASHGYMNATELADYLVGKGMPFRQAHETVGQIVVHAINRRVELQELPIDDLRAMSTLIDADVFTVLSVDQTLGTKSQVGGTAPLKVSEALAAARNSLLV